MKLKQMKMWAFGLSTSLLLGLSNAHAAIDSENIDVTPEQHITPEELAAIYVLSEICPALTGENSHFQQGYATLVKDYMPNEKDPVSALKQLSQAQSFEKVLKEAQQDAKDAGDAENKEICQDVMAYGS